MANEHQSWRVTSAADARAGLDAANADVHASTLADVAEERVDEDTVPIRDDTLSSLHYGGSSTVAPTAPLSEALQPEDDEAKPLDQTPEIELAPGADTSAEVPLGAVPPQSFHDPGASAPRLPGTSEEYQTGPASSDRGDAPYRQGGEAAMEGAIPGSAGFSGGAPAQSGPTADFQAETSSGDAPNEAPTDLAIDNSSVSENSPAGTVVGTVAATDPDAGETFSYALTDDAGGRFYLDGDVIKVAPGAGLDFESAGSHQITVEVTDGAGHTFAKTVDISVSDVAETISGTVFADSLVGDIGADIISGFGGNDTLNGAGGNDDINGGRGADKLIGGDGNDALDGSSGNDTLFGGDGNDSMYGGDATGNGKNTQIGGDDTLYGQAGDDVMDGGTGQDRLYGGADNDTLDGGTGNDQLDGGTGNDVLEGGAGADALTGGDGIDTASYADSNAGVTIDLALSQASGGDAAGDTLSGIENVTGSDHNDFLTGDTGPNVLVGNAGDDVISGGAGDDTLDGGAGDDVLDGGAGNDLFIFAEGDGHDTVTGGAGGGWTDVVVLQNAAGGAPTAGWTYTITEGAVLEVGTDHIDLSDDAAGTIILADGSEINFSDIERIEF